MIKFTKPNETENWVKEKCEAEHTTKSGVTYSVMYEGCNEPVLYMIYSNLPLHSVVEMAMSYLDAHKQK